MGSLKLVVRNLLRKPLRSVLTVLSLVVAIFLICGLRTLITTLTAGMRHADNRRLAVMSATGLFVELPMSYQAKIETVAGVERTMKFQWLGGYYRNPKNFFAQFAIHPPALLQMYPECQIPPAEAQAFLRDRTSCLIGKDLANSFGWKVGDTIPIIGALHPHPRDQAWEFTVAGIYHSEVPNFDNRTLFFHWELYEETLKSAGVPTNVAVFAIKSKEGADVPQLISDVEMLFANGPQKVDCATEAEFQRQFVQMVGNLPLFVGWIGSGVLIAILLACVNTMLMAMREQLSEIGILKSLGFTDAAMFRMLIVQSLVLCSIGGGLGLLLAKATEAWMAAKLGAAFPGFAILPETFALGAAITIGLGIAAGIVPAFHASRLRVVEALRTAE